MLFGNFHFMSRECKNHSLNKPLPSTYSGRLTFGSRGWQYFKKVFLNQFKNFRAAFYIHKIMYIIHGHQVFDGTKDAGSSLGQTCFLSVDVIHTVVIAHVCEKKERKIKKLHFKPFVLKHSLIALIKTSC